LIARNGRSETGRTHRPANVVHRAAMVDNADVDAWLTAAGFANDAAGNDRAAAISPSRSLVACVRTRRFRQWSVDRFSRAVRAMIDAAAVTDAAADAPTA